VACDDRCNRRREAKEAGRMSRLRPPSAPVIAGYSQFKYATPPPQAKHSQPALALGAGRNSVYVFPGGLRLKNDPGVMRALALEAGRPLHKTGKRPNGRSEHEADSVVNLPGGLMHDHCLHHAHSIAWLTLPPRSSSVLVEVPRLPGTTKSKTSDLTAIRHFEFRDEFSGVAAGRFVVLTIWRDECRVTNIADIRQSV
jgi:hypothetical protein